MKNFDFEAGKKLREEGDIVEALRCFRSALEEDRDSIETYLELAITYVLAFEESGDPLCLDSARKVCMAALRREPEKEQRRGLLAIQDRVEDLLLESQKAEMDALTDALEDGSIGGPDVDEPPEARDDGAGVDEAEDEPETERGH